ncbi:MAG: hypothetical protein WB615_01375 [Candidatus Tumulicola sp.]
MNRTTFLSSTATLLAASGGVAHAQSVPGGTALVERRADFDERGFAAVVGREARIRQVYEAVAFHPPVWNNVKNSFNGLQFGFGYPAHDIAVVFAGHGPSASYGYTDYVWKKYRIPEYFGLTDASGAPIASNVYFEKRASSDPHASPDDDNGMYQDTSIAMLQQRGLVYLTCHTAAEEQARSIVKKGLAPSGMTAADVADDILTHLIPGAIVVPSMVATIGILQATYRYSYITLAM